MGSKRCTSVGCTSGAVGASGKCIRHGGGKRCMTLGCTKSARSTSDNCKKHGGGKRCMTAGCTTSARGDNDNCVKHGGGKRCTTAGCTKSAQGASENCKEHGGGKRCATAGCTKSSVGATNNCIKHGGGKRCTTAGCTKSAIAPTDNCKKHGGGKRCMTLGCTKSARSTSDNCREHGGGARCQGPACRGGTSFSVNKLGDLCYICRRGRSLKKHEARVKEKLEEWNMSYSYHDQNVKDCDSIDNNKDRPDFVFLVDNTYAVVLEVDENYHRNYEISCEVKRISRLTNSLLRCITLVRYNPAKKREDVLKEVLEEFIADGSKAKYCKQCVHVVYVGYPRDRVEMLSKDEAYVFTHEERSVHKRRNSDLS